MTEKRPNMWMSMLVWLLPDSRLKQWALRLLGHDIGRGVLISPTLVMGCGKFSLDDGAKFAGFNVFRNLATVTLEKRCFIGNFNQFTAAPEYQRHSTHVGKLILKEYSGITNRHYFDCSGQIILEPYSGVGGIRSIFQSHEIDLMEGRTSPGRITLGVNAMTGTGCTLLKGAYLPDRSVLAARSVMGKARDPENMPSSTLYGGIPARPLKEVKDFAWWDREDYNTPVTGFDDTHLAL